MKHKLIPEFYKQIKQLALTLPELQKLEGGKPMFRKLGKRIGESKGSTPNEIIRHIETTKEPVLVNHEVNMVSEFKKGGMVNVLQYCAGVNLIVKKFNEKENERKAQTTAVGAES